MNSVTTRSLTDWHWILARRFELLAAQRRESGWPVFALEHGLTRAEVDDLALVIRSSLQNDAPSTGKYLPWVVYSAEFGYRYAGEEYWKSFAEKTPGWREAWRNFIRDAFVRFARRYFGAVPEGAFANNFTIICWPITHGILPLDLQRQFARVLYEARSGFRPELFTSAEALGKQLRALSGDASARFREFTDNTLLLGQIAAALLLQEEFENETLISTTALQRIIEDISRERAAAAWFDAARSSVRRLAVRGLSTRQDSAPFATDRPTVDDELYQVSRDLGIGFILRRGRSGVWDVLVEVPDLAPLVTFAPQMRELLSRSQGKLTGAASPVIARGRLLFNGTQRFLLTTWPTSDQPLVSFDSAEGELKRLLETVFRAPSGATWLFKISPDEQAHRLKSRVVHPGSSYIILSREPTNLAVELVHGIPLSCGAVFGAKIDVPQSLSEPWEAVLRQLGLEAIKTLRVWPAGLPMPAWDAEGSAEMILGDEVMLGITADHRVEVVEVALDGVKSCVVPLTIGGDGETGFVSLGCPSEGRHNVTIRTLSAGRQGDEITGYLTFNVRRARLLLSGHVPQYALLLAVHPSAPSLEDLWEGRAELQVSGPIGTSVVCTVSFWRKGDDRPLLTNQLPELQLPIDPSTWRAMFAAHVKTGEHAEADYDAAYQCTVEFDAGSLGRLFLTAEREFRPLRWAIRRTAESEALTLIDDSGQAEITVTAYDVIRPDEGQQITYENALQGLRIDSPGKLLVAEVQGQYAAAVAVPISGPEPPIVPTVTAVPCEVTALTEGFRKMDLWESARVKGGTLALVYRSTVLRFMLAECFATIGGSRWGFLERSCLRAPADRNCVLKMSDFLYYNPSGRSLARDLEAKVKEFLLMSPLDRCPTFFHLVDSFLTLPLTRAGMSTLDKRNLCDLALRAASSPLALSSRYVGERAQAIESLLEHREVARAARFLVLMVAVSSCRVDNGSIYAGWEW